MFHDFRTVLVRGALNLGGEVSSEECRHVQFTLLFFIIPLVFLAVPLFFGDAAGRLYETIVPEWQTRVLRGLSSIRRQYPSAFNPSFASGARSLNELKGVAEYHGNRMPVIDKSLVSSLDALSDDLSRFIFTLGGPEKKLSRACSRLQASSAKFVSELRQACGRNFCDSETRDLFESVRRALEVLSQDSLYSRRESEALADMLRDTAAGIDGYSSNIISVRRSVAELEALSEGLKKLDVTTSYPGIDVSHLFAVAEILDDVQDMLERLSSEVPEGKMTLRAGLRRVIADVSAAVNQIAGGGALGEETIRELAEELSGAAGILGDNGISENARQLFTKSSGRLTGLAEKAATESDDVGRIRAARTERLLSSFSRLHPLADPLELLRHDLRALKRFLISARNSASELRRVPDAIDHYLTAGVDLKRFGEYADTAREASDSVKLFTAGGVLPENTYFEDREIQSGSLTGNAAPEGTDQAEIQLGREKLINRTMDDVREERAEKRREKSGLPPAAIEAMNSLAMALENESSILREISLGGVTAQNIETYLNTIDAVHSRVGKLNYDAVEYRNQKRGRKELITALRRGALLFGSILFAFFAFCEFTLAVRRLREAGRSPLWAIVPLASFPLFLWSLGKGQYIFSHPSFQGVEESERSAWLIFFSASLVMLLPMLIFSMFTRPAVTETVYNPRIYGNLPDRKGKEGRSGSAGGRSSGNAPEADAPAESSRSMDEELISGETWKREKKKEEEDIPPDLLASAADNPEFSAALFDVVGGSISGLVFIFSAGGIPEWFLTARKETALKLTGGANSGDPEILSEYYLKSFGMEGGRSAEEIKETIRKCCGEQITYLRKPENSGIRGELMIALAELLLADSTLSNRKRYVFRQLADLLKISPFAADKYMNDAAAVKVKKSSSGTQWNSVRTGAADRSSMFIHVTPMKPLPGKNGVPGPLGAGQSHGVACALSEDDAESAMAAAEKQGSSDVIGGRTISEIRDGKKAEPSPETPAAAQTEAEPEHVTGARKKPAGSAKARKPAAGKSDGAEPSGTAARTGAKRKSAAKGAVSAADDAGAPEKKKKTAKRKTAGKSAGTAAAADKAEKEQAEPEKKKRVRRAAGRSAAAPEPAAESLLQETHDPGDIPAEEIPETSWTPQPEDVPPSPDVSVRRRRLSQAFGRKRRSEDDSDGRPEAESADGTSETSGSDTIGWDSVIPGGVPESGDGQDSSGEGKADSGSSAESETDTIGWDSVFPGGIPGQAAGGKEQSADVAESKPDSGDDGTIGWNSVFPGGIPDGPEHK